MSMSATPSPFRPLRSMAVELSTHLRLVDENGRLVQDLRDAHRHSRELQHQLNQSNGFKAAFEKLQEWYYKTKEDFQTTIEDQKITIQTLTKEMDELKVNHTPNNISDNNSNNHINRCNSNTYGISQAKTDYQAMRIDAMNTALRVY